LKISKNNSLPLSDSFNDELLETFRKGKKNNILETLTSKNIYLSNSIIESIQKIVDNNATLLENSSGDPFLENACCNSNINTIIYFITKDKTILENNNLVNYYTKTIESINDLNKSSILYHAENTKLILPLVNSDFNEETIYKAFIYYCNFNNKLPIDEELKSICMDKPNDFDETKEITEIIETLKQQGKIYNKSSLDDLLNIINKRNIFYLNLSYPIRNNIDTLRDIVSNYQETLLNDNNEEKLFELLYNILDTYDITNINDKELDNIKNYLAKVNNIMKNNIFEHIRKLPDINKKFVTNIENFLKFDINTNLSKFYETYLDYFINIFPNIILNKNIEVNNIPSHWQLSETHNKDIVNILNKYYNTFNSFSFNSGLELVFKIIKNKSHIFLKLIKFIKYKTPITISNSEENYEIPNIFDKEFIKYFYSYIFYNIINEYINITSNQQFILEVSEYDHYNEDNIKNDVINYIYEFLNTMHNHLNLINNNYKNVKEKISYSKEKEKDLITEYLKDLTDEEREVENIFKNNKLENWSVGLQKGLTQYVAANYDEERNKMEKQALKEYKLNKISNVTEMNKEIYKMDIDELARVEEEIENEEYNMNNIPDDDDNNSDLEFE
jgi:hypothetical protein